MLFIMYFLDINECSDTRYGTNGGCAQNCHNYDGGHRCPCNSGFYTEDAGKTCPGFSYLKLSYFVNIRLNIS